MANYDFQNDFQNDAARKNYDAAMSGETRKGVDFFEKPLTWDEERIPRMRMLPTKVSWWTKGCAFGMSSFP